MIECVIVCCVFVFCYCIDAGSGNTGHGPARSRDRNERGETAMHVAAIKGDQDGIKKLLDQGMSPNVPDFAGNFLTVHFIIGQFYKFLTQMQMQIQIDIV